MRKIELERKEMQEKVQKELELIKSERDSFKEKNSAARARNKIITQVCILQEKSDVMK